MLAGLPGDPVILLGVVNTKLRDFYRPWRHSAMIWRSTGMSSQRNWMRLIIHMMLSETSLYNG